MQLNDDVVELKGHVVAFTDKGVLLYIDKYGMEDWFPKSQLGVNLDVNLDDLSKDQEIKFTLPSWIALERGLFDDD